MPASAESARRYRDEPYALDSVVDGDLRHFYLTSALGVRALAASIAATLGAPLFAGALAGELGVAAWDRIVPIPGRMAPARTRARVAAALGTDLVRATRLLDVCVNCWLLLTWVQGGIIAFAGARLLTLTLHPLLGHPPAARQPPAPRGDRRDGIARLPPARPPARRNRHVRPPDRACDQRRRRRRRPLAEHAARILASLGEANRVMNDLLAFGQDRTLNLYRHDVEGVVREAVEDSTPRASARRVDLRLLEIDDVAGP